MHEYIVEDIVLIETLLERRNKWRSRHHLVEFDLWKYFIPSLDVFSYLYLYHIYNITCLH